MAWLDVAPGPGRNGGRLDTEDARLSSLYLTVSATMYQRMGAPKAVNIQVDPVQLAIRVTRANGNDGYLFGHHANKPDGRWRLSIKRALEIGGMIDIPAKRGIPVQATVSADGSTIFRIKR